MATEYNITQKQYNGTDYDTLYPQTTSQQVLLNDGAISYTGSATVNGALIKQQADITSLNSNVALTLTAATGVTLSDASRVYLCGGKYLYIYVKGQATQTINNGYLCTFSGGKNIITPSTVPIGIGTEWDITSVSYGFLSAKNVVGRVQSGQWFHVNVMVPVA